MFSRNNKVIVLARQAVSFLVILTLLCPAHTFAQVMPSIMSGNFIVSGQVAQPVLLKGIHLNPDNPFQFDFIIDAGDTSLKGDELKKEASKLIKYFFAALTVPDDDLWVNLSPYEHEKIIPEAFGNTELGRDLLDQDYVLKRLVASLLYPEGEFGKKFWNRIYEKVYEQYGTTDISLDTFNKVWVIPDKASVYSDGNIVYALDHHFKVMMEEDYIAWKQNSNSDLNTELDIEDKDAKHLIMKEIVQEIIIPEIEKEVNEGEHFTILRQVGSSMMLGAWYKMNLREGILAQSYVDQNKIEGVDTKEKQEAQRIYSQYLEVFRNGVFNYIKEEYDPFTKTVIPRKYFSGGARVDYRSILTHTADRAAIAPSADEDILSLFRVNVVSSPVVAESQEPWSFMDLRSILDDPDRREYGDKTVILAQFLDYLEKKGVTFGSRKPVDLVPELFIISLTQSANMSDQLEYSAAQRQGLERHLDEIGKNRNLIFGDAQRPLIVAIRAAPDQITPGMALTVLNVGINDQTVEGLVNVFAEHDVTPESARKTAYELYAKLIEDFLVAIPNSAGKKYPRGRIQEITDEYDADPVKKVEIVKALYHEHFQDEFPQDVYRQLNMVTDAIPIVAHYGKEDDVTRHHAVIIQRMVIGALVNERFSGAGELTSRDPLSGDRLLAGTLERGRQGDTTTGYIRVLGPEDLNELGDFSSEDFDILLEHAELFLKGASRIETTVENGVPYLLQLRRMERSDEVDIQTLWNLLNFWREDERRGVPEENRRGLSPDEAYDRGKQYLVTTSLRKRQALTVTEELVALGKGVMVSHGAASGKVVIGMEGARRVMSSWEIQGEGVGHHVLFQREIGAAAKPILEHPAFEGAAAFDQIGAHVESLTGEFNIPGLVGIELGDQFSDIIFDYGERRIIFKSEDGDDVELYEGRDHISIAEDGTIYKGEAEVVSTDKPEGMSKEAVQFIMFLLEHQGKNAAVRIQVNAWNRVEVEEWPAEKFEGQLERVNNPEHSAFNREEPLYGPIVDVIEQVEVADTRSAQLGPTKGESRRISDAVIQMAADHVIRVAHEGLTADEELGAAHSQRLDKFIFWLWRYYNKLPLIDHQDRAERAGRPVDMWVPSAVTYTNTEEARMKFFLAVLDGAEDMLARSIFYWVERHKVAAFTFKQGIFPNLTQERAQSLFQKIVKYGIQEGSYRAVDYMFIRILTEMVAHDNSHGTSTATDLINNLEPVEIKRRKSGNPREFETVTVPAEAQKVWIFVGLSSFYFERELWQKTRDRDLPSISEVSEFLQVVASGDESDTESVVDSGEISVRDILAQFEQGDRAASSPLTRDTLGGIDLRTYDRLLENTFRRTIPLNVNFDISTELHGIIPQINGITPITSIQIFNLN